MRRTLLLILAVPGAILALLAFRSVVYDWYRIPSGAMAPTIPPGTDGIRVLKCAYQLRLPFSSVRILSTGTPQPGDVVVFRSPDRGDSSRPFIMRVVAVAGDTVEMRNEVLYVNQTAAPLSFAPPGRTDSGDVTLLATTRTGSTAHQVLIYPNRPAFRTFSSLTVPPDHVFVLGDNRDLSRDSRFFGPRPYGDLLGRVIRIRPKA